MRKKAGFGRSKRHGGKTKIKKDQNNNDELVCDQEEAVIGAVNIPQMQNDSNGNKRFELMISLLRNKQSQNRLLIIKIGNLKQVMKKKSLKISKLKEKI
jgi:putative NADH-flavin reductase